MTISHCRPAAAQQSALSVDSSANVRQYLITLHVKPQRHTDVMQAEAIVQTEANTEGAKPEPNMASNEGK